MTTVGVKRLNSLLPADLSPKCLRFGHRLTLCTVTIHLLTNLLFKVTSASYLQHSNAIANPNDSRPIGDLAL